MTNKPVALILDEKPRLIVRKSLRGMQIQIVEPGGNVISGTWAQKKNLADGASRVAQKAIKKGIKKVRFDRGKHPYHGLVKLVAMAARQAGLEF